jgi:hypothetical protein
MQLNLSFCRTNKMPKSPQKVLRGLTRRSEIEVGK